MKAGGAQAIAPREFELIVIAASAGGLPALRTLLGTLPADFPLPIAIVLHLDPNHISLGAEILDRRTKLCVKQGVDGDVLRAGVVYLATPDAHLVIGPGGIVRLARTPRVHFLRPAADRLFETAAAVCGRVIAVVLTGSGTDGAAGVTAVKAAGGVVIAQDKGTSDFFGMPQAAIGTGAVDFILPLDEIGRTLVDLTETK